MARETKISFDEIPPGLNKSIALAKTHWHTYSSVKAYWKVLVLAKTARIKKFEKPVEIEMTLTFPTNRKRDLDNLTGCLKYIMDGLKCIVDDNSDIVQSIKINRPIHEKGITKCEIIIREISEVA